MFDRKKLIIIILGGYRICYFNCLPPYHSNFRYFEIKSLVSRTTNLRDSSVLYSTEAQLFPDIVVLYPHYQDMYL